MTAYVTLSGYRYDEYLPHVFRTTDAGNSWQDISSNLPDAPVNDIIVDPNLSGRLYLGTDVGVFYTNNLGNDWEYLGEMMPNSPIVDLVLHNPTRTLIAATYGRSMYSIDLTGITEVKPEKLITKNFVLEQNYPNPFNPTTKIKFTIQTPPVSSPLAKRKTKEGLVTLKVYNTLGEEIVTLINEEKPAGEYEVEFNGSNLPSGVYFYQLRENYYTETKKMVLMK
jgi:hypothetical protein